ncbi:hypothetical protein C8J56DRAFT_371246 [Mycena floridula]|nr:hypothetical protein C8J56DRAFT_371246 [Mycena floridula]
MFLLLLISETLQPRTSPQSPSRRVIILEPQPVRSAAPPLRSPSPVYVTVQPPTRTRSPPVQAPIISSSAPEAEVQPPRGLSRNSLHGNIPEGQLPTLQAWRTIAESFLRSTDEAVTPRTALADTSNIPPNRHEPLSRRSGIRREENWDWGHERPESPFRLSVPRFAPPPAFNLTQTFPPNFPPMTSGSSDGACNSWMGYTFVRSARAYPDLGFPTVTCILADCVSCAQW